MIHRFVDLFDEVALDPIIIYNLRQVTGGTDHLFSLAGGGAAPDRLTQSRVSVNAATLDRPELSPDGSEYVYVWTDNANPFGVDEIRIAPAADDSAPATIASNPSGDSVAPTGGTQIVGWSPDGQQVYYRGVNNNTDRDSEIRVVDRDGTNNTLLWSSTAIESTDWGALPRLSPDGTMIAFWVDFDGEPNMGLWVMSSDGTGATRIYDSVSDGNFFGWSPDSTLLLFQDVDFVSTPRTQKTMTCEPDGSNVTVLYNRQISGTIEDEVLLSFGQESVWLPDMSGIVCRYELTTGAPTNHEINVLSTDGAETFTALSPQRLATDVSAPANENSGPVVFGNRTYWLEGTGTGTQKLVSAEFDGSNYRVDHDLDTDPVEDDYVFAGFDKRF